jgi:RNA polymerase sigma factor (sigma-70 family)
MLDFEMIYAQHYIPILRYCNWKVRNTAQAEDLTQDTFLSFFKALPQLGDEINVQAYLYRVAGNKVIDFLRHKHRIEWIELTEEIDKPVETDFTEQVERQELFRHAMAQLMPSYRATLIAWLYEKSAFAHSSSFKMTASRARKAFRKHYVEEVQLAS